MLEACDPGNEGLVVRLQEMHFGTVGTGMCWVVFRADKMVENIVDVVAEPWQQKSAKVACMVFEGKHCGVEHKG